MNRVDDIHINSSESSHLPARVSAAAGTSVAIARFNILLLIKKKQTTRRTEQLNQLLGFAIVRLPATTLAMRQRFWREGKGATKTRRMDGLMGTWFCS